VEHPIKIESADNGQQREALRDSLFLTATMRRPAESFERTVRVRNLSAGGMMADCTDSLVRGEPVVIALRGIGEVGGKIAWRSADKIGVAFDTQIDPKAARKPIGGKSELFVPDHIRWAGAARPPIR
jgi:hypothetical protein